MKSQFITILLAFIVLIHPFASLTLFLDLTKGYSKKNRRRVARVCSITVVVSIAFFTLMGDILLKILGISIGSFQLAGGILVFLIALNMMNGDGNPAKPDQENVDVDYVHEVVPSMASAIMPLAFPMIIGPGGISTVIIYAAQASSKMELFYIVLVGVLIGIICYIAYIAAHKISQFLGEEGLNIINRVMGMLLAAVAVEIFFNGLRHFIPQILGG